MSHTQLPDTECQRQAFRLVGRWPVCLLLAAAVGLTACANRQTPATETASPRANWTERQQAALAAAQLLPEDGTYQSHYFDWDDHSRQRNVQAKLYLPQQASDAQPVPLVVFSHGIGGSREGYTYLGKNWAAQGIASLHVQHTGSDNKLWSGSPLALLSRMQEAAQEREAVNRVHDLRFALDRLLADASLATRLDSQHVVAAGHSYGANTVLLAAGAQVEREAGVVQLRDDRIEAAILISAPPFHGEASQERVVAAISMPTLHITATGDNIAIPGYTSNHEDRVRLFESTGSLHKTLVVYREGSHSMFTDRLQTGGPALNPLVKAATVDLTVSFIQSVRDGRAVVPRAWPDKHRDLLAQFVTHTASP